MIQISDDTLEQLLSYELLIPRIKEAFQKEYNIPKRHHHQYPNPAEGNESTLLLMPAWDDGDHLGVKVVNVSPNNSRHGLPTIQGTYLLYDLPTGSPKAQMDAKILTNKRTAATSALASSLLSRSDSTSLLVVGTGSLCSELIQAHRAVRPIQQVFIWGRNFDRAISKAVECSGEGFSVTPVKSIEDIIHKVDIVTVATLSPTPLIEGKHLVPGQHYDMIGAYKPDMREADDSFITQVSIHVDTFEGATTETGDLAIPLKNGVLQKENIKSQLSELCIGTISGRQSPEEITCFKSVGHALEDLAAASLAFETLQHKP